MGRLQRVTFGHGMLVILVAMLAGFMLIFSLTGGFEVWPGTILSIPVFGTTEGWVRAHTGGVTNGLLVLAVAYVLLHLNYSAGKEKFVAYGFVYVAWSFTIFYWFGNAAGNRALTLGDNPLGQSDLMGVIGFLPALPSVFLVLVLLVMVAKALFSTSASDS